VFACLLALAKARNKGPDEVAGDLLAQSLFANEPDVWMFYENHLSAEAELIKGLGKQAEQPTTT
jgi:hypothetical protein